jgi:hypothetical protein
MDLLCEEEKRKAGQASLVFHRQANVHIIIMYQETARARKYIVFGGHIAKIHCFITSLASKRIEETEK